MSFHIILSKPRSFYSCTLFNIIALHVCICKYKCPLMGVWFPWDFHRLHRAELQDQLDEELLLLLRSSWFISAQWRDCVPVLSKWLSCLTTQFWRWSAACCSFMMCETFALFALRLFSGKRACAPHCPDRLFPLTQNEILFVGYCSGPIPCLHQSQRILA